MQLYVVTCFYNFYNVKEELIQLIDFCESLKLEFSYHKKYLNIQNNIAKFIEFSY